MKIGFWNIQGTKGLPASKERFNEILSLVDETAFFAFLEHYTCEFDSQHYDYEQHWTYNRFLEEISYCRRHEFFSTVDSHFSANHSKWSNFSRRTGISPEIISRIKIGIGISFKLETSDLFPNSPFRKGKELFRGFLSSVPSENYSSLIYQGNRNSEPRQAIFLSAKVWDVELIICTTHFSTLMEERNSNPHKATIIGSFLRKNHSLEICKAITYLNTIREKKAEIIVLGDFNCPPDSEEMLPFKELGLTCCFNSPFPITKSSKISTDYVWHSKLLKVRDIKLSSQWLSDHKSIVVDFSL